MALLEIHGNGESSYVSQDAINNAIQLLEDPLQKVEHVFPCLSESWRVNSAKTGVERSVCVFEAFLL